MHRLGAASASSSPVACAQLGQARAPRAQCSRQAIDIAKAGGLVGHEEKKRAGGRRCAVLCSSGSVAVAIREDKPEGPLTQGLLNGKPGAILMQFSGVFGRIHHCLE
eukprot:5455178-Alexandrium_andersonii.AAC.1